MSAGLNALRHIVVLMMENRLFDHMLGSLKAENPAIDGLTGAERNPDTTGTQIRVQPLADYQGQLDPDPDLRRASLHRPSPACRRGQPRPRERLRRRRRFCRPRHAERFVAPHLGR